MYKMQGVGSNHELFLPRRGKGLFFYSYQNGKERVNAL